MNNVSSVMSTTGDHTQQVQTEENTKMPFEASQPIEPTPLAPPKKKRIRLTPKQRAAKIAAGWNPPGPRPQKELSAAFAAVGGDGVLLSPAPVKQRGPSRSDLLLKGLVDKLVALENDAQYRAVWTHYFTHGGVYTGPKYLDELTEAIQYLIGIESAKTDMGK